MECSKEDQSACSERNGVANNKIQYVACLIVTLNLLSSGMHYGWTSPSLPQLLSSDSKIQMTNDDGSWLAVMVLLGGIIGSCLCGVLLNLIGRKKTILLTTLPLFISWIMIAFAESYRVLIVARLFAGIAEAMSFCGAPTYIGEIADKKIRGFLATMVTVGAIIGIFIVNIVGSYLTIKTTGIIASIVPIITFLTFCWMPESPYFLLMKNKTEQAKHSLRLLKGKDDVESEIVIIQQFISQERTSVVKYWQLFKARNNRKALFIVLCIRAIQQFCGATSITLYAQTIFYESKGALSPIIASSIYFGFLVLVTIASSILVDRIGRKRLLVISTLGAVICLVIETIYFYYHPKTSSTSTEFSIISIMALVAYVSFFGIGLQTIPVVVECEIFAANIKAFAICLTDISFSLFGTIVSKLFQYLKDEFELYVPFLMFAVCSGIGLIFIVYVVPETKGKSLETIQVELAGIKDEVVPISTRIERP